MIKGIAHLAFDVADMEKSLHFYCDILGFTRAFDIPNDQGEPWIEYIKVCEGQFIELFYGGQNKPGHVDRPVGFSHLCLEGGRHRAHRGASPQSGREAGRPAGSRQRLQLAVLGQGPGRQPDRIHAAGSQIAADELLGPKQAELAARINAKAFRHLLLIIARSSRKPGLALFFLVQNVEKGRAIKHLANIC